MSFSANLKTELVDLQLKKVCCKKAFLLGLLTNNNRIDSKIIESVFLNEAVADKAIELLKTIYAINAEKSVIIKPGKKYYKLTFPSKSITNLFDSLITDPEAIVQNAFQFKCSLCEQAFLRGVFLSTAKLTDPQKSYQLEFSFLPSNISIASKLYRFLTFLGFVPKIVNRSNSIGLYFKSNTLISDVLYYIGAIGQSFEYANAGIEKEIRNNENRATNCVTKNIFKSVSASKRQIEAIKLLIDSHKFDSLSEELKQTAIIRLDNEDATLSELALLHNPPISKSGLNHRLQKLCEEAELIT